MTTLKSAGAACPKCQAEVCAEFRGMLDTCTRWACNSCGARGEIAGSSTVTAPAAPQAHKHWRDPSKIKAE